MELQLKGKKTLVTGSTAGIGYAIAKALLREDAAVVINGRTAARVESAVARLKKEVSTADVSGVAADLSTSAGLRQLRGIHDHFDIVVNNLGVYEAKRLDDMTADDLLHMFTTNVVSGAVLTKEYLAGMKQKNWGRVIFIASEAGVNIPPDMIPYGVSKAAQIALARGLAETTAGSGVTVNAVLPGPTYSEGIGGFLESALQSKQGNRADLEKAFLAELRPTSLIKRFATAEEVAHLVTYLASPLASATNGAAVRVEGGLLRGIL